MKKIIFSSLLILFSLFFILSVKAEVVHYVSTYPLPDIKTVIAESTFNIMLQENANTTILKTDFEGNILVSKSLDAVTSANIIKGIEGYYVIGREDNQFVVFILDDSLRTVKMIHTSTILPKGEFHLYFYKKEVYVLCLQEKNLATSSVFIIGEDYSIREVPFSQVDHIREIVKKDYPLLEENIVSLEEGVVLYEDSTYKEDTTILVGSYNNHGFLTIKKESTVIEKRDDYYQKYLYTTILNDSILVLAEAEEESALLLFDLEGNKVEEYKIDGDLTHPSITKGQKLLYITVNNSVITYNYETMLQKDKNIFGTLTLEGEETPYEKVRYTIAPNSGYQVKEVLLKNDQGDLLEVKDSYFIMPNTNAYLSVIYEETIENPNTADPIVWIILLLVFLLFLLGILYKKWNWLKK